MFQRIKGFKLPEPMCTHVPTEQGYRFVDALSTRQRHRRCLERLAKMSYVEIGDQVSEFFLETAHGGYDSIPYREIRARYRLLADLDLWFGSYDAPPERYEPKAEQSLADLVNCFNLEPDRVEMVKSAIMCILNCNGASK